MTLPVLAVISGEPAGIGPDICLDLAFADLPCRCVVLGDKYLLQSRAEQLGKTITLQDFDPQGGKPERGILEVLHIPLAAPCQAGKLNPANAAYVLKLLDTAYQGISDDLVLWPGSGWPSSSVPGTPCATSPSPVTRSRITAHWPS